MQAMGRCNCTNLKFTEESSQKKEIRVKRSDVLETHKTTSADSSDGSPFNDAKHVGIPSAGQRGQGIDVDSSGYHKRKNKHHRVHVSSSNASTSEFSVEDNSRTSSSGDDTDSRTSSATVEEIMIHIQQDMHDVVTMFGLVFAQCV